VPGLSERAPVCFRPSSETGSGVRRRATSIVDAWCLGTVRTAGYLSTGADIPGEHRRGRSRPPLRTRSCTLHPLLRNAGVVATEFSILYYALAVWRRKPFAPARARASSNHRKNGLLALLYTVLATAVIDPHWNSFSALHLVAAHIFLVVDAFAVLWILGYARAGDDASAERADYPDPTARRHRRVRHDAHGHRGRFRRRRSEHFLTCSRASTSVRLRHSV
jgi:hypothetical protein